MATISPPEDIDVAIKELPASQIVFTDPCALSRRVQAVCFHYELSQQVVDLMAKEGFVSIKMIREANPDGDEDEKDLFHVAMELQLEDLKVSRLQRLLTKRAFRRMCRPLPLAAISAGDGPPSSKRPRSSAPKRASTSDNPGSSSSAATTSATASSVAPATVVGASTPAASSSTSASAIALDDDDSSSDGEFPDDGTSELEDSKPVSSKRRDLVSLFEDIGNEVRFCFVIFLVLFVFQFCFNVRLFSV